MRSGLIEFTMANSFCSPSWRTIRSASSKLPSIATIFAACAIAWINFTLAIFPSANTTAHGTPARAELADHATDDFPIAPQLDGRKPQVTPLQSAPVMTRYLYDHR